MFAFRSLLLIIGFVLGDDAPKIPKMHIAYLKWDWSTTHGSEGTGKLVQQWTTLLRTAQVDAMMFPLGTGKIMLMGTNSKVLKKARRFILEQDETDFYVSNKKHFYPAGRSEPLTSEEERERLSKELNISDSLDLSMFENLMGNLGNDEL